MPKITNTEKVAIVLAIIYSFLALTGHFTHKPAPVVHVGAVHVP